MTTAESRLESRHKMMLVAEAELLTPLLIQMLVVGAGLLLGLLFFGSGDATRGQPLPDMEEEPDPVQVAYLRRQTSGLIELVMFDLLEQGRLEVVENEEDEEFWSVRQLEGSEPPEAEDPWPGQRVADDDEQDLDDDGELDDDDGELDDDEERDGAMRIKSKVSKREEIWEAYNKRSAEEDELEDDELDGDEEDELDEDELDGEDDDELDGEELDEEDDEELDEEESAVDGLPASPGELVYRYFETPKYPRQALRPGGGLHSLLTFYTLPIQRLMVERHLMRSVASFQGCASGCLMAIGIITLVAFVMGTFYHFITLAFDGHYLPLVVFTVSLLLLRQLGRMTRFRLIRIFRFLRPRTSWGERYLQGLESRFDSLMPSRELDGNGEQGKASTLEFASAEQRQSLERLAVAVFGSWVLVGGPHEDLAFFLGTADPGEPAGPGEAP
jgi:hypothetical protein